MPVVPLSPRTVNRKEFRRVVYLSLSLSSILSSISLFLLCSEHLEAAFFSSSPCLDFFRETRLDRLAVSDRRETCHVDTGFVRVFSRFRFLLSFCLLLSFLSLRAVQ